MKEKIRWVASKRIGLLVLLLAIMILMIGVNIDQGKAVVNYPDMPVINDATCWACHTNFYSVTKTASTGLVLGGQHPMFAACGSCHAQTLTSSAKFRECTWCHYDNIPSGGIKYMSSRHSTDGAAAFQNVPNRRHDIPLIHQTAASGCNTCHAGVLTQEHFRPERTDKNGTPINCDTCHAANYLGDQVSTNGQMNIVKTQAFQTVSSPIWYTPEGTTTSRIYIEQALDMFDRCEVYVLYNGQWGLIYRVNGVQNQWIELPAPTNAFYIKMVSSAPITNLNWGIDAPKVVLTPGPDNLFYQNIKSAISAKDTRCESCHTQTPHEHAVTSYDQNNTSCASCHATNKTSGSTDLVKLHLDKGYTCDTCHANPQIAGVIILENGSMNIPECGACHDGSIAPTADVKHQTFVHSVSTFESSTDVDCASCHYAGSTNGSAADLVKLHSSQCGTCHDNAAIKAANIINYDGVVDPVPVCSTCHNTTIAPESSAVHQQHDSASAYGDYIYNGEASCLTCHPTMPINTLHLNTITCNSCHASTITQVKDVIDSNLSTTLNKQPYTCADCHNSLPNKHQPEHLVTTFDVTGDSNCVGCHNKSLTIQHNSALVNCNSCHGENALQIVKDVIAANFSRTTPSPSYTCKSCHTGTHPSIAHPVVMYESSEMVQCASCHATDKLAGLTDLAKLHSDNCSTCHDNLLIKGTGIIDGDGIVDPVPNCSTCHNSIIAPLDSTVHLPHDAATGYGSYVNNGDASCTTCHPSLQINVAHATNVSCNTCHTSTVSEVKTVIDNNIGGAAVPYVCSDCHNSLPNKHQPEHLVATFDVPGDESCASCHDKSLTIQHNSALLNCNSCHGENSPQTIKDVIAANYGRTTSNPSYTCKTCHTGPHPSIAHPVVMYESSEMVQCASCHATDKPAGLTDLAKLHSDNCSTCHNNQLIKGAGIIDGDGIIDPVPNCSTCHNGTIAPLNSSLHQSHPVLASYGTYAYNGEASCSTCHPNLQVYGAHDNKVTCNDCHTSTNQVVRDTINNNLSSSPIKQPFTCSDCHNSLPNKHQPEHLATTFDTTGDSNCASCHNKNLTIQHNSVLVNCNSCHGPQALQVVKDVIAANFSRTTPNPSYTCKSCHPGTHPSIEHPVNSFESNANVSCNSCHATDSATGKTDLAKLHGDNCSTCHDNQLVKSTGIIDGDGTIDPVPNCSTCHNGTIAPLNSTKHQTHDSATGYGSYIYNGDANCTTCHPSLQLNSLHDNKVTCDACHTSTVAAVKTVIDNNIGIASAAYTCADCHNSLPNKHQPEHQASTFDTTGDGNCAVCHNKNLTIQHNSALVNCNTCHGEAALQIVKDVIAVNYSRTTTTPSYTCKSCHTGVHPSFEHPVSSFELITNVSCATCHATDKLAGLTDLAKLHGDNCSTCHGNQLIQVAGIMNGNGKVDTIPVCSTCHNGTIAPLNSTKHQTHDSATGYGSYIYNGDANCTTCHPSLQLNTVHDNKVTCDACHTSTVTAVKTVINNNIGIATAAYTCADCHNSLPNKHQPEHLAKYSATNMDCNSCHGFPSASGVATDIMSTAIHKGGCNTCHGSTVRSDVQTVIASKHGQSNAVYNCEDCHGVIHSGWDAKHKPILPTTPLDCSSCHNNYLPAEHTKAISTSASSIGYSVFRATTSSGPWTAIGSTTATGYADTGLAANTAYYYQVKAYDGKPNYSGNSNTISVTTLSGNPVVAIVNPDSARYASGNNGDSSADPSSTTNVLTQLTDNSNNTYSTVKEAGSYDQYVFVNLNNDAKDYTKVELKMSVRYYNNSMLTIYPYSTATGINTNSAYTIHGPSRTSSYSFVIETIDVTNAAKAMNGFGWMKFRIKPDTAYSNSSVYIANVQIALTQNPVSGGSAVNPPGTLPSNPSDTSTPSAPSGLTGTSSNYDRINLTWAASTDTPSETDTCVLCHGSNARQQAKDAVKAKNANCSACHTIHSDIPAVHTGPALPTTPWDCAKCHTNILSIEHSSSASLKQNSTLDCNTCHKSTLAKVTDAINSTATNGSNLACTTCHTGTSDGASAVHTDITTPHLTGIFPTAVDSTCLSCHPTIAVAFAPANAGYHAVNGLTPKTSGLGSYINGWTATSKMTCKSCHGSNGTSPTSAYTSILFKPFTTSANSICTACHNSSTYGGTSSGTISGSSGSGTGFKSGSSNLHTIGDHSRAKCINCHTYAPHGGGYRMLGTTSNTDAPFASSANLIRVDRVTSYSKDSCATNCGEHSSR